MASRNEFLRALVGGTAGVLAVPLYARQAAAQSSSDPSPSSDLVQYFDEAFGDWVQSGGEVVSQGGLSVRAYETVIYRNGVRVLLPARDLFVTTQSDTYVDAGTDGNFHLSAVPLGADAPPTAPTHVRLALVRTGSSSVVSVTDLRITSSLSELRKNSASTLLTLRQSGSGHTIDLPVTNSDSAGIYIERSGRSAAIYIVDRTSDTSSELDLIDIDNRNAGDGIFVNNHGTGGGFKVYVGHDPSDLPGVGFQAQVWKGLGLVVQNQGSFTNTPLVSFEKNVAGAGPALTISAVAGGTGPVVRIQNYGQGYGLFIDQVGNGRALQINQRGNDTGLVIWKTSAAGSALFISDLGLAPSVDIQKSGDGIPLRIHKLSSGVDDCIVISNRGTGKDISGSAGLWSVSPSGYGTFRGGIRTKATAAPALPPPLVNDGDHEVYWDGVEAWAYWRLNGQTFRIALNRVSSTPTPTPSPSASPTPTPTHSPTLSPDPSATPSPTPTPSPSASPTPTPTHSPTLSP